MPDCSKIKAYRDGQLEHDFRKAEQHLKLNQGMKNDLLKMRKELLESGDGGIGIFSMNFVISRNGLATGQIAAAIKLICDKFNDTLDFVAPEAKGAQLLIKESVDLGGYIIDQLKSGGDVESAWKMQLKNLPLKGKVDQIRKSLMLVWNYADNMKEIVSMEDEQKELIAEVRNQLNNIDSMIQKYEKEVNLGSHRLHMLETVKENINKYIRDNCSSRSTLNTLG